MRNRYLLPVAWCVGMLFSTAIGYTATDTEAGTATSTNYPPRDLQSDTWIATDALGRTLPGFDEVGPPRQDRTVAIFYFLWLGAHEANGPKDISKILAEDPDAMGKPDSPLWGPLHAAHHWGESIYGYYRTNDPYVLRKHAQLLTEAGVDVVIFDVTNQITYKEYYEALCKTWSQVRSEGGKTPQIAFLTPFWAPKKVVNELYENLYKPGLYKDLWFIWDGKPFILADPDFLGDDFRFEKSEIPVEITEARTLGQTFTTKDLICNVAGRFPTYNQKGSAITLTLYRDGPSGEKINSQRFKDVGDNAWLSLNFDQPLAAGTYYLEASASNGKIGWWSTKTEKIDGGTAFVNGKPVDGARELSYRWVSGKSSEITNFFTFRRPQPDYFMGQTKPDMWSWLEVYPQHMFKNSRGEKEQMSVGVAQNAVDGKLATLSAPNAHGRSFAHDQGDRDTEPNASRYGYNFSEQFELALKEDPRVLFITGWNEWIAGRFDEFAGVRMPVMFVDQFNMEHSRDIEPSKSDIGDDYYYQLVSFVRHYKGVNPPQKTSGPKTIELTGDWSQWDNVSPEFRDDRGDPAHRDHDGYNQCTRYTNDTGRNDLLNMKVAADQENIYFYVETADTLTSSSDANWMRCLIDVDQSRTTGWEGFDFAINAKVVNETTTTISRYDAASQTWQDAASVPMHVEGNRMMVAVPRRLFGEQVEKLSFKWVDNVPVEGDFMKMYTDGDVAPEGRYQYLWMEK